MPFNYFVTKFTKYHLRKRDELCVIAEFTANMSLLHCWINSMRVTLQYINYNDTEVQSVDSLSASRIQLKLSLSVLIWIPDCTQFLMKNHLNGFLDGSDIWKPNQNQFSVYCTPLATEWRIVSEHAFTRGQHTCYLWVFLTSHNTMW